MSDPTDLQKAKEIRALCSLEKFGATTETEVINSIAHDFASERRRLLEKFRPGMEYLHHKTACNSVKGWGFSRFCDCGLEEFLSVFNEIEDDIDIEKEIE